ncbi:Fic family protein [Helicobacter suis]|uniref:Fic family protein n=1 Tax=Helicobacter suis TaxID=104628 RepID=UPI0003071836|nr:Fic family protein [Helicobacter suis]BCD48865.1 hypothetical protein NHP194004_03120 [Helicobacter suis]BDR27636.1 hypothetical protein HSHS1_03970 [Helicobacter suis HS1]GFK17390.1 hypothetical protein NHP190033_15660 [Helicobacter suis]
MALNLSALSFLEKERLFKTLRTSITHHSNALEGLSLSFGETKTLLESGRTAHNKPIHEQLIILGFANAYDAIIREASNPNRLLDTAFIKDIHYLVFEDALKTMPHLIPKPIGAFRSNEARIVGSSVEITLPHLISQELENLLFKYPSNNLNLEQIALFHARFEQIHPFSDGNGRTGRLIMAYQTIQNDLIPPLILNEQRTEYLNLLEKCQVQDNSKEFAHFLQLCQQQSLELIRKTQEISSENQMNSKHRRGRR